MVKREKVPLNLARLAPGIGGPEKRWDGLGRDGMNKGKMGSIRRHATSRGGTNGARRGSEEMRWYE